MVCFAALYSQQSRDAALCVNMAGKQVMPQHCTLHVWRQKLQMQNAECKGGFDLAATPFAILSSFNNSWQVQHLDLSSSVMHDPRYACQGCKLIRSHLQELKSK